MAKWTTEQIESVLGEARDLGNWRGDTKSHLLAVMADILDWVLTESREQRAAARERLAAAMACGESDPVRLRQLIAEAARGPADEDEGVEVELVASVTVADGRRAAGASVRA